MGIRSPLICVLFLVIVCHVDSFRPRMVRRTFGRTISGRTISGRQGGPNRPVKKSTTTTPPPTTTTTTPPPTTTTTTPSPTTTTTTRSPTTITTTRPPTITTTTRSATTTTTTRSPTTRAPSNPPPSIPATPPPTVSEFGSLDGLQVGAACNVSDCGIVMGCKSYLYCKRLDITGNPDKLDGVVAKKECKMDFFPDGVFNISGKIFTAACFPWAELSAARKEAILQDRACTYCTMIPQNECSSEFRYRNEEGSISPDVVACPIGYVADPYMKSCTQICDLSGELRGVCLAKNPSITC